MTIGVLDAESEDLLEDCAAASVSVPAVVRPNQRNEIIDVVRFFAAAAIVLIHAVQSSPLDQWINLFRFSVPFFLFASLYYQSLSYQRHRDRPLGRYIVARFNRLYLPFLAWSVIYFVEANLHQMVSFDRAPAMPEALMLLCGTKYHLWFLPFLLICSIVMELVQNALRDHDARWRWLVIAASVTAGCAIAGHGVTESTTEALKGWPYLVARWQLALPAACWAMAFALFMTMGSPVNTVRPVVGMAGIALVCVCSVWQTLYGIHSALRGLCGLGCMVAAMVPRSGPTVSSLASLGRRSYGVYLSHVLAVRAIHLVWMRLQLTPSTGLDLATFVLGFMGSLALVMLLEKSPRLAWLNG